MSARGYTRLLLSDREPAASDPQLEYALALARSNQDVRDKYLNHD